MWNCGIEELWNCGIVELGDWGIVELWNCGIGGLGDWGIECLNLHLASGGSGQQVRANTPVRPYICLLFTS